jgi:hypothetical protein
MKETPTNGKLRRRFKILKRLAIALTVPAWVPLVCVLWCVGGIFYFMGWLTEGPIRWVLTGDGKRRWFTEEDCPF